MSGARGREEGVPRPAVDSVAPSRVASRAGTTPVPRTAHFPKDRNGMPKPLCNDLTPQELLRVARAQKGALACTLLGMFPHAFLWMEELALIGLGLVAVLIPAALAITYRLATTLRMPAPKLYPITMFLPFVSLLVLYLLTDEASKALRSHGFRVGLMEADTSAIEAVVRSKERGAA